MDTISQQKHLLRQAGITARRALTPAQHQAKDAAICDRVLSSEVYRRASVLLVYSAVRGEVNLSALAERAAQEGKTVCYPLCEADHQMSALHPRTPEDWVEGAFHIPEPRRDGSDLIPPEDIDLILVPCTRFDEDCGRVGMGGGYYDRYLPRCTKAVTMGAAYECQKAERVPRDQYDRILDRFVTENADYIKKVIDMEQMTKLTCEDFLSRLSTKAPVPGGGGASALVGAIGVALGNMVGSLTVGKKKYAAVEDRMQSLNAEAQTIRAKLESLVTEDAVVFAPLSDAYRLPSATEEEKAHKAEVMEAALDGACAVPLEIMRQCARALTLVEDYAAMGSVLAVSDAGVAAVCCKAAMQGASLNVFINTKVMQDREKAEKLEAEAMHMLEEYCGKADQIYSTVFGKLHPAK